MGGQENDDENIIASEEVVRNHGATIPTLSTSALVSSKKIQKIIGFFNLSVNQLTGSLPSDLGLLNQLIRFDLNNNELVESVPSSLCGATMHIDCEEITCSCCISSNEMMCSEV